MLIPSIMNCNPPVLLTKNPPLVDDSYHDKIEYLIDDNIVEYDDWCNTDSITLEYD